MGERLFNDNIKKFIRSIELDKCSISDIAAHTKSSMHLLSDMIHVGRLESIVETVPNVIEKVPYNMHEVLYQSKDGYDPELYRMDFRTGNGVHITMNAYPERGYIWDDDEKDDLYFLCSVYFTLYERARLSNAIKDIAYIDGLTGALNINGLMKNYGELITKYNFENYTVGFVNLKGFKLLNRSLGFRQGDKLIQAFVDFIFSYKLQEEMIARLGGDNFVLVIRKDRMERLIENLSPLNLNVEISGKIIDVDISFRMGLYEVEPGNNMGDAIENAGTALAYSKREGKSDVVWYTPQMMMDYMKVSEIGLAFHQAILNQEFIVYYQPKVSLGSGELCGAEALVRWDKDGTVKLPQDFLPALENDGTICELDFYVFERVCMDIRTWMEKGMEPVTISVNLSKCHLKNEDTASKIIAILERYSVDPEYIEIEMTETACYEDYNELKSFIDAMNENGIRVSIDDFGTGYSSLGLLKDLKVDVVKLDQSFIRALDSNTEEENRSAAVVIRNIVKMVEELNMDIIAEGVETKEEADFLHEAYCDMAQGFLYDKPMAHDEYELILKSKRNYDN